MAWRIVKQPSGLYARFSDVVDNFTHVNMSRDEAVELCREHLGRVESEEKVQRADENPHRFQEELETVRIIHGLTALDELEKDLE